MIEDEIKKNSWINIKEELDFLFDMESEKKLSANPARSWNGSYCYR